MNYYGIRWICIGCGETYGTSFLPLFFKVECFSRTSIEGIKILLDTISTMLRILDGFSCVIMLCLLVQVYSKATVLPILVAVLPLGSFFAIWNP